MTLREAVPIEVVRCACENTAFSSFVASRAAPLVAIIALIILIQARRQFASPDPTEPGGQGHRTSARTITRGQWAEVCSPVLYGLIVLAVFLTALFTGGFYGNGVDGQELAFLSKYDPSSAGVEIAARAIWSVSLAAIIVAALVVLWVVAGVWLESDQTIRRWVCVAVTSMAVAYVAFTMIQMWWFGHDVPRALTSAFATQTSKDMLCATWTRTSLHRLGPITDGLNVIALIVPFMVVLAFCLSLVPPRDTDGTQDNALRQLSRRQRNIDRLLYVGAAMLMAGVVEVVALLSWTYAPFPGVNEVKLQADICKTSGSPNAHINLDETVLCRGLADSANHADKVDGLKRLVRSFAITFGAGFTALLARGHPRATGDRCDISAFQSLARCMHESAHWARVGADET